MKAIDILYEIELLPKEAQEKAKEYIEFLKFRYIQTEIGEKGKYLKKKDDTES